MLTPEEQKRLDKKLTALKAAQQDYRVEWAKRNRLDKKGDTNWEKYVKRMLKAIDRHLNYEYRASRVMYIRELYNRRKGKKSPIINI